jgi:hypothetical protein
LMFQSWAKKEERTVKPGVEKSRSGQGAGVGKLSGA